MHNQLRDADWTTKREIMPALSQRIEIGQTKVTVVLRLPTDISGHAPDPIMVTSSRRAKTQDVTCPESCMVKTKILNTGLSFENFRNGLPPLKAGIVMSSRTTSGFIQVVFKIPREPVDASPRISQFTRALRSSATRMRILPLRSLSSKEEPP